MYGLPQDTAYVLSTRVFSRSVAEQLLNGRVLNLESSLRRRADSSITDSSQCVLGLSALSACNAEIPTDKILHQLRAEEEDDLRQAQFQTRGTGTLRVLWMHTSTTSGEYINHLVQSGGKKEEEC